MSNNLYEAHVQWRNRPKDQRYESLQELIDAVKGRRMRSRSADVDVKRLRMDFAGEGVILSSPNMVSEPSHYSFGQFAGWVGAPPAYLRKLSPKLVADNINEGIARGVTQDGRPVESLKLMSVSRADGEESDLQAVTSTTYG